MDKSIFVCKLTQSFHVTKANPPSGLTSVLNLYQLKTVSGGDDSLYKNSVKCELGIIRKKGQEKAILFTRILVFYLQ